MACSQTVVGGDQAEQQREAENGDEDDEGDDHGSLAMG
jgi:hypothetical protein